MKTIAKIIKALVIITAIIAVVNYVIERYYRTKEKPFRETYDFKHGKINYTKSGSGSPVLVIHDLDLGKSSDDVLEVITTLENEHTVYALDLLGCGRSDKPNISYTNYLYVQLITDFIRDVIGEKADIICFKNSSAFTISAAALNPDLFGRMVFVAPNNEKVVGVPEVSREKKLISGLISLHIYGTLAYNLYCLINSLPLSKGAKYLFASKAAGYVTNVSAKNIFDLSQQTHVIRSEESMYVISGKVAEYLK